MKVVEMFKKYALQKYPIHCVFTDNGPFSFFAPTDVAIEKLLPDEIIILVENQPILDGTWQLIMMMYTFRLFDYSKYNLKLLKCHYDLSVTFTLLLLNLKPLKE